MLQNGSWLALTGCAELLQVNSLFFPSLLVTHDIELLFNGREPVLSDFREAVSVFPLRSKAPEGGTSTHQQEGNIMLDWNGRTESETTEEVSAFGTDMANQFHPGRD
jgi:hypothetical protein